MSASALAEFQRRWSETKAQQMKTLIVKPDDQVQFPRTYLVLKERTDSYSSSPTSSLVLWHTHILTYTYISA